MPRIKRQLSHLKQYADKNKSSDREIQNMDQESLDSINAQCTIDIDHHQDIEMNDIELKSDDEYEYEIEPELSVDYSLLNEIIEFILDGNATKRNLSILVYAILK